MGLHSSITSRIRFAGVRPRSRLRLHACAAQPEYLSAAVIDAASAERCSALL